MYFAIFVFMIVNKSPKAIRKFKYLKKCFLFFSLLLFCPIVVGQLNFNRNTSYLLFEDAATGEHIFINNDSIALSGPDFSNHFKVNFPKELNRNDFNYNKYQIHNTNYFVDDGCGYVLEFKNNTFKRIDNSFKHRNQFGAIPFQFKNTIYLWGGYGLFTSKNILTYYDFLGGEWLKKKQENIHQVVPRSYPFSLLKDGNLYFFGGKTKSNNEEVNYNENKFNGVWRLDLNDFTIHKFRQYDKSLAFINYSKGNDCQFQIDNKIITISKVITEVDIFKDEVKTYAIKNYKSVKDILYHKTSKSVTYVYPINENYDAIINQPYLEFRGDLLEETTFYEDTFLMILIKYTLLVLAILTAFFGFKYMYLKKKKNNLQISYAKNTNTFYFKKTPIPLNNLSVLTLVYFIERQSEYLSINELNPILSKDLDTDNYITINKRRERVLKELTLELSTVLKVPKELVFSYRKNKFDKRLKEIKLNFTITIKS